MADVKTKALALLNEAAAALRADTHYSHINRRYHAQEALCRAIEQHEAFRQEVHDAVWDYFRPYEVPKVFWPIIIWEPTPEPKPDPLVDVLLEMELSSDLEEGQHDAKWLRIKLDALGFEIREKNDD